MPIRVVKMIVTLLPLLLSACADPARITLMVGDAEARVEIAATPEQRSQGLMFRQALDEDAGMLLVFPEPAILKLWMLNVAIPLDAGFFDCEGRLINSLTMQPDGGQGIHHSAAPACYALEMNAGWFARERIVAGDRLEITPMLRRMDVE